ncbi:MAG: hypothetical protein OEV44_04340 [Spirochaetota bacterium]|nr:hypothetical protein [Spirochaetota bacterium]
MTDKYRLQLIREGNKFFNEKNVETAKQYFMKANYKDGMLRVADYFFYEKKLPLNALPLYMKCGSKERVDEIYKRMAFALGKLLQGNTKEDINNETTANSEIEPSESTESVIGKENTKIEI